MSKKQGSPSLNKIDKQFQCVAHEFSNDSNFVNFKRTLVRAPQIVKQKINVGIQIPNDEEFEKLFQSFLNTTAHLIVLKDELCKYHDQISLFITSSSQLCEKFGALFNPNIESTSNIDGIHTKDSYSKFSSCLKLTNKLSEIKLKTLPSLAALVDNVSDPITKIISLTKNIKLNIKERDFAILDVNKYMNSLENLNSRIQSGSSFTLKQQQNLIRYEKSLELSNLRYNQINNNFKKDLPIFIRLVSDLIHPLSVIIYYIQLSIHYDLLSINEIDDPSFISRPKDLNGSSQTYFDKLVDKFIKSHLKIKDQLDNLTINKSKEEIDLKNLIINQSDSLPTYTESLKSSFIEQSSVLTDYQFCIAQFDFNAQQIGDLSFQKGDKIKILDSNSNKEWWKGELKGQIGIFPRNYIKL